MIHPPPGHPPASPRRAGDDSVAESVDRARPPKLDALVDALGDQAVGVAERVEVDGAHGDALPDLLGLARGLRPSEPAICRPSASAWPTQDWFEARAIQWAAAGQAENRAAAPTTATAATRMGLCRSADMIASSFRRREGVPGPAAEDRGGFRCRASVLDSIEPPVGRDGRAQLSPGADLVRLVSRGGRMLRGFRATGSRETPHAGCC